MARYAAEFNKTYPNVHVKFEPISDYENDVKIRMNSTNYGDVLMIPAALQLADYPKFFAPLGSPAELSQKYRFTDSGTYNGQVYGYVQLFTRPDLFQVFIVGLYYLAAGVVQMGLALYVATVLSFNVRFRNFFKGLLFLPYLINGVAIGFVFLYFF